MKNTILGLTIVFSGLSIISCSSEQDNSNSEETVSHQTNTPKVVEESISKGEYLEKGQKLALTTKGVLGKNLMGKMQAGGPVAALEFCNLNAYPLVDSMSLVLDAQIKRVSDMPRNPLNTANEQELAYIASVKQSLANGVKPKPMMNEIAGKMVGYYPIVTNEMCLKCHGNTESEIETKTLAKIAELYPTDMATGYSSNQLRGIWVVGMNQ